MRDTVTVIELLVLGGIGSYFGTLLLPILQNCVKAKYHKFSAKQLIREYKRRDTERAFQNQYRRYLHIAR